VVLTGNAQVALCSRLSQFLGRISFGLYLTHLLVICSFSSALFIAATHAMPYAMVVLVVGGLTSVVVIAVAFGFTVVVEERLLSWIKKAIAAALPSRPSTGAAP
jgi:peptidoglycan/LPS O-acetylase OafA/YrhL